MTRVLTLTEKQPGAGGAVDRLLQARDEAPRRRPLPPNVAFANFVDAHRHLLVDWMARRTTAQLIGPDASQIDPDDVLSRALERLWLRFDNLPREAGQRKAWVEHALRLAALDAIRFQFGRHKISARARRPPHGAQRDEVLYVKSLAVDFGARPTNREREGLATEAGRAIQRLAAGSGDRFEDVLTRAAVVAAIATLTTSEQRVLRLTLQGCEPKEIVTQTGLEPAEVREQLTTARWLVRSFVDHADADRVPERHRLDLHAYLDGHLRGRARTRLRRHLRECAACQRAAGLYRRSEQQTISAFALPALIATAERTSGAPTPLHWLSQARPRAGGQPGGAMGKVSVIRQLGSALPGGKLAVLSTIGLLGGLSAIAGAAAEVNTRPDGRAAAVAGGAGNLASAQHEIAAVARPVPWRVSIVRQRARTPRRARGLHHATARAAVQRAVPHFSTSATSASQYPRPARTGPNQTSATTTAAPPPSSSGSQSPSGAGQGRPGGALGLGG